LSQDFEYQREQTAGGLEMGNAFVITLQAVTQTLSTVHNDDLAASFDKICQVFNHAAAGDPGYSFDDLADWFDPEVILRRAYSKNKGKKGIFVRKSAAVIKYCKQNFTNAGVIFTPMPGQFSVNADADTYAAGDVCGEATWVDNGAPQGEPISFIFNFYNAANSATAKGDWKVLFLYGSNG